MSEPPLYQDSLITVTADRITTGALSCPMHEVSELRIRGGTGIEEKIFLSLIAFFALGVAGVGLMLSDRGELLLGLGLAAVTIWIIFQHCTLTLITAGEKRVLLRHRDVRYVRKVRNVIDDAVEALRDEAGR
ncbi:MAG: DUF6232 family protein [Rhodospirillaceae bacterium]